MIYVSTLANDLLVREYTLSYGTDEREKSLILEITDDGIAENEEIFILYTNFTETANDRCAIAVRLQDNDSVLSTMISCIDAFDIHIIILSCSCVFQLQHSRFICQRK